MSTTTATADCGHTYEPPGPNGGASGYACLVDGRTLPNGTTVPADGTVCYDCADAIQLHDMTLTDRFGAYLSSDGRNVTTWTGGVLARVIGPVGRSVQHTPSGGRYEVTYVRAVDASGNRWHGRGPGEGCYLRLRRSKSDDGHSTLPAVFLLTLAALLAVFLTSIASQAVQMMGGAG